MKFVNMQVPSGHMQLIECVPNFSEGRNLAVINEIARAIATVDGAYLLHKDIGYGVNRTVMTIAGSPTAVVEAAFKAIDHAARLIDMRNHSGEHPRIGATDVCPIIPLAGVTMAECVDLSLQLAQRVGLELKIPVYLYGQSARLAQREDLAYLRKGQYESLASRMAEPEFEPDFGPAQFNARSGATVIGARPILIAYNINLETCDLNIARSIAATIRQRRENHSSQSTPYPISFWKNCQAIGWFVKEYDCCQISMNLLDYKKTPLFDVYQAVGELAVEHGIRVTGSEIIGLVPLSILLEAGKGDIEAAVKFLNLNEHQSFVVDEKVLEYKLAKFGLNAKIEF